MNLKKTYLYLLIFYLVSFNIIKCDEFDEAIDAATSEADAGKNIVHTKKAITYEDVLKQIIGFGINNILAKDLFKKTNTVLKRSVLTLPIFNLYHTDHICQDWLFRFALFGNSTNRAFFAKDSPFIKSYIAVDDKEILNIIEDLAPNAPKIIEMIKHAKKQERRAGFMFQSLINFNDLSLEIDLPLFYEERNYFFTQREKEELEEVFGGKTEKEQEKQLRKHAVSDKFGFGDARIKLGLSLLKNDKICIKAGLQSTLPIAFAFKKGIIGSNFSKVTKLPPPPFDFKRVFELEDTNRELLGQELKDFGITALDWLSAMVLDSPMGNGGHFGLGFFVEPQIKLHEAVTLKALGSLEYLFTNKENRFFLEIKDKKEFATSTLEKALEEGEEASKEAVLFLNEQVIQTLFPPVFKTDVTPGFMAQITIGPQFKLNEWYFFFGYDFWFQDKEKIRYVFCNPNNLNIKKALKRSASSNKLFATLSYNKIETNRDWVFSINFEEALASKGVGKDFSVSVGFEFNY
jgi:hypothetical protein